MGVYAQSPEAINYQAVARNLSGVPLVNQGINVRYEIRLGSAAGSAVYIEDHALTTNQFGLFTAEIGNGTPFSGSFSGINWGSGSYYLYVEVNGDPMGATQLLSVPYALYSKESANGPTGAPGKNSLALSTPYSGAMCPNGGTQVDVGLDDNGDGTLQALEIDFTYYVCDGVDGTNGTNGVNGTNGTDGVGIVSTVDNGNGTFTINYSDATSFTTSDLTGPAGTNGTTYYPGNGITLSNDTIINTGDNDNDANNELISTTGLNGSTIEITEAGTLHTIDLSGIINSNDTSATNEIQTLSINTTSDTIFLSNGGGYVFLPPASADTDWIQGTGVIYNITDKVAIGSSIAGFGPFTVTSAESEFRVYDFASGSSEVLAGEWSSTTSAPQVRYQNQSLGFIDIGQDNLGNFVIQPSDITRFSLTQAGNVGIGTRTPTNRLQVVDSIQGHVVQIQNKDTLGTSSISFSDEIGIEHMYIGYGNTGYPSPFNGVGYINVHDLVIASNNAERMRIDAAGNVGIGTSTPSAILDVEGTFQLVDGTEGANKVLTSDAFGNASWQNSGTGADNWGSQVVITDSTLTGNGTAASPLSGNYTAGTGIDITGEVITNTAPDQTVLLQSAGATTVSGTYPNFTISSTDNVNDADSDPTNEIELPATASTNEVLTWNGSAWVAQAPGAGADNWGSQTAVTDGLNITGDGTAGSPITLATPIPTNTSELTNDSGFITSPNDADNDPTNEIELPATASTNEVLLWNGSAWVAGSTAPDGDGNSTNEIQNLSVSGNNLNITGGTGTTISTNGPTTGDMLYWDGANWTAQPVAAINVDDADADPNNEIELPATANTGDLLYYNGLNWVANPTPVDNDNQDLSSSPAGSDVTVNITGGTGTTFSINDADYEPTNELQTLSFTSPNLSISSGNSVDLSGLSSPSYWSGIGNDINNTNSGHVGVGTTIPGVTGFYSAISSGVNRKTLTVSAIGAAFVDDSPATIELKGGNNTIGSEIGVIDFIHTNASTIDYNFARISAHNENANPTYSSLRFYTRQGASLNEAMRIDPFSNIGIGIATPTEKLHLLNGTIRIDNGTNVLDFSQAATQSLIKTSNQLAVDANGGGTVFTIDDGNADFFVQMRIQDGSEGANKVLASDASGFATWTDLAILTAGGSSAWSKTGINIYPTTLTDRLGLGTATPSELLHMKSTDSDLDIETNDVSESSSIHFKKSRGTVAVPSIINSVDYFANIQFMGYDGSSYHNGARIEGSVDGAPGLNNMPGKLVFYTNGGSASETERMRINSAGNVGIGTTTPGMIAGATNYLTIASNGPYAAGSVASLELKGNTNGGNSVSAKLDFLNGLGTNNTARIEVITSGSSVGEGQLLFYTNGGALSEKMRINEDGNVGIRTSSPGTALEVNGAVTYTPQTFAAGGGGGNFTLTVGDRSYMRITTAFGGINMTGISNGVKPGQLLIIENVGGYLLSIDDGQANLNIEGNAGLYTDDTITLIWTGAKWLELARSNN